MDIITQEIRDIYKEWLFPDILIQDLSPNELNAVMRSTQTIIEGFAQHGLIITKPEELTRSGSRGGQLNTIILHVLANNNHSHLIKKSVTPPELLGQDDTSEYMREVRIRNVMDRFQKILFDDNTEEVIE